MDIPRKPKEWDDVFMNMAQAISERSKDPNTQIGAVIVDSLNRLIATGFNGPPRLIQDDMVNWDRPEKYTYIKHAEDNAIWYGVSARGLDGLRNTVLYVTGPPCLSCMLSIIRAEITAVVYDSLKAVSMLSGEGEWEKVRNLAALGNVALIDYRMPRMQEAKIPQELKDVNSFNLDQIIRKQDIESGSLGVSSKWGD